MNHIVSDALARAVIQSKPLPAQKLVLITLSALICFASGIWAVSLGPDRFWDFQNYHLYAPYALLHDRYLFDIDPAQRQGFTNPFPNFFPYALIFSELNNFPRALTFLFGAIHGANAILIGAIAWHVFRYTRPSQRLILSALSVAIGYPTAQVAAIVGTTMTDMIVSAFALLALLTTLKITDFQTGRPLLLRSAGAGLFSGMAIGMKLTAVAFAPALGIMVLLIALRRRSIGVLVTFGAAATVGFLVCAGYHMLVMWREFGNPIFPFFNQIFRSPYYDFVALSDDRFLPKTIWQRIAYPFFWVANSGYVSELGFRDIRGALEYIAIVLVAIGAIVRRIWRGPDFSIWRTESAYMFLALFAAISYYCWASLFGIYRYFVGIEMLSGVIVVGALVLFFKSGAVRIAGAIVVLAATAGTTKFLDVGRYTAKYGDKFVDVQFPVLPSHSLVLILSGEPVGYLVPFADPSIRFFGIDNNLLKLDQTNELAKKLRREVADVKAARFVLSLSPDKPEYLSGALKQLGLRLGQMPCLPINANFDERKLTLCPITNASP